MSLRDCFGADPVAVVGTAHGEVDDAAMVAIVEKGGKRNSGRSTETMMG